MFKNYLDKNRDINYRPELDGLRAIAVIAVIINHFNDNFLKSGYLGVDIFFVISGFLITLSLQSKENKSFWEFLSGFYSRRIKRLLPALIFYVLLSSIFISFFDINPVASLRTGLASLFGISNLYLIKISTDYFASSTDLNIFTHTWSLGVEEQFYFLFPLLIWVSGFSRKTRKGDTNLLVITLSLSIVSIILFSSFYYNNQPAAYFLMPTRFWEMAAGSITFLIIQKKNIVFKNIPEIIPTITLIGMIVIMTLPIKFGLYSTFLIVFLSMIYIFSVKRGTNFYYFVTDNKMLYLGKISYSLYLWHWGILCLSRWTIGIHWWSIPFQIVAIFLAASFSYNYIENPFREGPLMRNLSNLRVIMIGLSTLIISSGPLAIIQGGLKGKLFLGDNKAFLSNISKRLEFTGEHSGRISKKCHTSHIKSFDSLKGNLDLTKEFIGNCYINRQTNYPLFAFIGDSHTLSMFPLSEKLHNDHKFKIFFHSRDDCAFPQQGLTSKNGCYEVMKNMGNFLEKTIIKNNGGIIFTTSYLSSHFGYEGSHRDQFKKYPNGSSESIDKNLSNYIKSLKSLAENIEESNGQLIVVAPLPRHPNFTPDLCSPQWFRPIITDNCLKTEKLFLEKEREHILNSLKNLERLVSNIHVYDVFDELCDTNNCYAVIDKTPMFIDDNHLSQKGAEFIYKSFLKFLTNKNLLILNKD